MKNWRVKNTSGDWASIIENGQKIAEFYGDKKGENVKLAAAAPQLVCVIRKLLRECENYLGPCICGGEMTEARRVLCRALGGDEERANDGDYTKDLLEQWLINN